MKTFSVILLLSIIPAQAVIAQFSWTKISSSTSNVLYAVSFADTSVGTAVGASGTILHTTDSGLHWGKQRSGTTVTLKSIDQMNIDTAIAVGDSGTILRTTDRGLDWTQVFYNESTNFYDLKMIDNDTGIAVGIQSIYRTTDGGLTWFLQATFLTAKFTGIGFEDRDSGIAIALWNAAKTTDAGRTWRIISSQGDYSPLRISSPKENIYFTAGSMRHVGLMGLSTDAGYTWQFPEVTDYEQYLEDICFRDSVEGVSVGGLGIVMHTTDAGSSWMRYTIDTTAYLFGVRFINPDHAIAVGWFGEVYQLNFSTVNAVDNHQAANRPARFSLSQNYPNPWNPNTTIQFQLQQESRVNLKVCNLLGQELQTIVDEKRTAGVYDVNVDGSGWSSGIYFYRLEAVSVGDPGKTFTSVKKMVLIK